MSGIYNGKVYGRDFGWGCFSQKNSMFVKMSETLIVTVAAKKYNIILQRKNII